MRLFVAKFSMRTPPICLFIFISAQALSQKAVVGSSPIQELIFRTKGDSIANAKLDGIFRQFISNRASSPTSMEKADSLMKLRRELLNKSIGFRYVYRPRYTLWDTLAPSDREEVTRLTLFNWRSEKLPDEVAKCKNLETLEIVNSTVGTIQEEISALPKLRTIELYNNKPSHRLRFKKNTNLTTILIRAEGPGRLPRTYKRLKMLKRLDLSRTKLKTFPRIYKNQELKELILTENSLGAMQLRKFKTQKSIEFLDIRGNKIKTVPDGIENLPNLKTLWFNFNQISYVSPRISRLLLLEDLSFYSNSIMSIPSGVYKLKSLRKLDLYYNNIEKLDSSAVQWKNLSILGLDNNVITSLPANIGEMRSLTKIYLNNNRLSMLPEGIGKLTQLKALQVNRNYLTEFPEQIVKLTNLEDLDLSNNHIPSLPGELFDFRRFEILCLYGNPWNEDTKEKLPAWVEKLRSEKTFVLIEAPAETGN